MSSNTVHKPAVAQILNASPLAIHPEYETLDPNSKSWDVINVEKVDDVERYAQVYHNQTSTYAHHLLLRGAIVDLVDKKVVCPGLGYTPKIHVPHSFNFFNGSQLADEFDRKITFDSNCIFTKGVEGPAISVWKRHGKVHVSTHRKISFTNSKWPRGGGRQKTYPEMWADLNGPDFESLFSEEADSESVHNFVICHPDVVFATHADIETLKGIYYIGSTSGAPVVPTGVKTPVRLDTLLDVGNFLRYGHSDVDEVVSAIQKGFPRALAPGEFVMMTKFAVQIINGQAVSIPIGVFRLESEAYSFRVNLRLKISDRRLVDTEPLMTVEPNTTLAYFAFQDASLDRNLDEYKLPCLTHPSESQVKDLLSEPSHRWNLKSVTSLKTIDDYKYNSWLVFLMCAPLCERQLIFDLRSNHAEIQLVTAQLILNPPENIEMPRRAVEILERATEWATKKKLNIATEVENLVKREYGRSLYKLHKDLTRPPRPQKTAETKISGSESE